MGIQRTDRDFFEIEQIFFTHPVQPSKISAQNRHRHRKGADSSIVDEFRSRNDFHWIIRTHLPFKYIIHITSREVQQTRGQGCQITANRH